MIRSLEGTPLQVEEDSILLDVSGFGLEILCSRSALAMARVGERLRLSALLVVNDAGMSLFGFADDTERAVFQELTQVKGVGGRLAIGLLRRLDSGSLIDAVAAGDASRLSSVPGVGAKRAQAICFELKSRFEKRFGAVGSTLPGGVAVDERVLEALEALGFSRSEGAKALLRARGEAPDAVWGEEALLSSSLRHLSRR